MTTNGEATVINDRYEVHKRIGRGGMADVFSARDLLLDRQVAIKVLFPEFATDENFVERFRREAQAAANLSHPNIVNVYDWGKYEGTYFIAMEEVEGRTLGEILADQKQLTSQQAAEVASEVAAALGFAHEKGVAHRDIKPANILIGSNGQVKVADFGIARVMNAPTEANLTQVGSVMGTATYFSPEQAQGAQPDPRSDLYSLGIVMYEMVAGRPPFTGENPVSIAYKQVHDLPQPLVNIVADVPKPYEAIVAKLLAKDPKLRYPSAGALRDDIRRFRNDEPVQALVAAVAARATVDTAAANATRSGTITPSSTPTTVAAAVGATATGPARAQQVPSTGMYEAGYPTGASLDAAYYDTGSSRTGWYALAAFLALVALVVGGVLLFQALSGENANDEPTSFVLEDYVNRPLPDVTAELDQLGLLFKIEAEPNAAFPENFVHRTVPASGEIVLPNAEILLFFNPAQELQQIPNVVGRDLADAEAELQSLGFEIGTITFEENSDFAENTVLATTPTAGTPVEQGTIVSIVVAGADTSVQVPAIINQTETTARETLEAPPFEFIVTAQQVDSETVPAGVVISISPDVGSTVERGDNVTIVVSTGPPPVTVPPVKGLTQGQATNQLRNACGSVVTGDDCIVVNVVFQEVSPGATDDGRVIDQNPAASTQLSRGSTVTITVGRSLEPATTLAPTTTTAPTTTSSSTSTSTTTTSTTTTSTTTTTP